MFRHPLIHKTVGVSSDFPSYYSSSSTFSFSTDFNLCQCETLDHIKMHLSATEYGPYLQYEIIQRGDFEQELGRLWIDSMRRFRARATNCYFHYAMFLLGD